MLMINVATKKANLMPKHGRQLVYLCHCLFNACNWWEFLGGVILFGQQGTTRESECSACLFPLAMVVVGS